MEVVQSPSPQEKLKGCSEKHTLRLLFLQINRIPPIWLPPLRNQLLRRLQRHHHAHLHPRLHLPGNLEYLLVMRSILQAAPTSDFLRLRQHFGYCSSRRVDPGHLRRLLLYFYRVLEIQTPRRSILSNLGQKTRAEYFESRRPPQYRISVQIPARLNSLRSIYNCDLHDHGDNLLGRG